MNKRDFPRIHFYDQDFVDIYDRTWAWIADYWTGSGPDSGIGGGKFFFYPPERRLDQLEQSFASFFLVYSNRIYSASNGLDALYSKQEESGAIRWKYDVDSGAPVLPPENPEGVSLPLFAWAEYNLYHKSANKKRVKEVMPVLQRYYAWLEATFKRPNGLFEVPVAATGMDNSPRDGAAYLVDFNAAMAVNALYMSALGDILNDKEISFQYKRNYFSLKTRINNFMWNVDDGFYYDVDAAERQVRTKTIGGFWPLLAEIPNEERAEAIIAHLTNPATFGTENPFPTVAVDSEHYDKRGIGYRGSVLHSIPTWSSRASRSTTSGSSRATAPSVTCTSCSTRPTSTASTARRSGRPTSPRTRGGPCGLTVRTGRAPSTWASPAWRPSR